MGIRILWQDRHGQQQQRNTRIRLLLSSPLSEVLISVSEVVSLSLSLFLSLSLSPPHMFKPTSSLNKTHPNLQPHIFSHSNTLKSLILLSPEPKLHNFRVPSHSETQNHKLRGSHMQILQNLPFFNLSIVPPSQQPWQDTTQGATDSVFGPLPVIPPRRTCLLLGWQHPKQCSGAQRGV